jgi:rhodanese-related sulfurtransferase
MQFINIKEMNQRVEEIDVVTAHQMITNGAVLVDIREWEEIEMIAFDMENQIMLPQSKLANRFFELPTDKAIIVGCHSGRRSLEVARFLILQNFRAVYSLEGGIDAWHEKGFPVKWDMRISEATLQPKPSL